jgi:hypothetical protein
MSVSSDPGAHGDDGSFPRFYAAIAGHAGDRRRRRWWIAGGAVILASAAVALVLAFTGGTSDSARTVFDQAVANLKAAPGIAQTEDAGPVHYAVQVTKYGEATGSITLAPVRVDLLTVGGTSYVKTSTAVQLPSTAPIRLPPSSLVGTWVQADDQLLGTAKELLATPATVAGRLHSLLAQPATRFPTSLSPSATIDGIPALTASTPGGDLSISAAPPYRVLRLTPRMPVALPLPHRHVAVLAARLDAAKPGELDVGQLSVVDVDKVYDDLKKLADEVKHAVNPELETEVQGKFLHCSPSRLTG